MKHCIVGGLAAVLMAEALIAAAPPASAGCQYGGLVISKCDGPVQPDGTWQRCVVSSYLVASGASSYLVPDRRCDLMGPDQHPWGLAFADPPTQIDD
ncbi:CDGP domain-containing protein [Mycobacterium sp.]|uniref:CDGP domain-containing protein n=1 Tax=Mycobacterium sp. TaxID=1785 RepID=UPI003F9C0AAF